MASGAILLINARIHEHYRTVLLPLGLVAMAAAVRELDYSLEILTFKESYKLINVPLLMCCGYLVWRYRLTFAEVLPSFSKTTPFYLILLGFVVVTVYVTANGTTRHLEGCSR